jgi:ABC-2 type transport system permease protein
MLMAGTWAVARRELFSLWVTPLAWFLLCTFLLMNGTAFVTVISALSAFGPGGIDVGPVQAFYGQSVFVPLGYVLVCPLLSMRALAEERRTGTAELLLSSPLGTASIVLGKFLALSITYVALWAPTLLYPLILRNTGQLEWPVVATTYIGVIGLGLGFVAVGLFTSSITENQFLAAAIAGTLIVLLLLCGVGEQLLEVGPLHDLLAHLSIQACLAECAQGVLSLRRLLYLATLVTLPLFLATRAVDGWRGP